MLESNQLTILREICDELEAMLNHESDVMLGDGPTPIKVMTEITRIALRAAQAQIIGVLTSAGEFDNLERFARIMFGARDKGARIIKRANLIDVLLRNFDQGSVRIAAGRFNQILKDLGFEEIQEAKGGEVVYNRRDIERADVS